MRLARGQFIVWFGLLAVASPAWSQDWPRFRGPNGGGVSAAAAPVRWNEKDFAWKVKLPGVGHSSPVVWKDRLFITSGDDKAGKRFLCCLKHQNGTRLWTKSFPAEKHRQHDDNSWASATPAVDDRHVYFSWATPKDYVVVALNHAGAEQWRKDLGPFRSGHGFGVSPIVHDDLVIVANEQEGKSEIVALDRTTGNTRWKAPRRSKTTYSTPCVFAPRGKPAELILGNYEHGVTSLDPTTGNVNWEMDVFDKGHVETSIASPITAGDLVIGCSGWLGVRKEVIAVRPPGPGEKPKVVYRLIKGMPLVPTPLVVKDLLFCWGDEGVVTCADAKTGTVHWQERVDGSFYSSPICAGAYLYALTRDGEVVVLRAAKKFEVVARNPLGEGSHSTPAIVGDMLIFRTFQHLSAITSKQ